MSSVSHGISSRSVALLLNNVLYKIFETPLRPPLNKVYLPVRIFRDFMDIGAIKCICENSLNNI